ncbi:MAG: prolipoprotein diacylglyceryl transferase [Lachnospiraceae bacterium]|nr:prolipoprotein diacylglyceryl transferase [Lachnospiraceae bacterium]
MYNDLFSIGPFTVHGYGLMIGIGIIVALLVTLRRAKKLGLSEDAVLDIALIAVPGGFIGAKLLFVLVELPGIISGEVSLGSILSGFVVYGGVIGGVLAGMIYCKVKKLKFLKYFDLVLPVVALAQGFGRIGCFLAGCCYGKETNSIFGIVFTHSDFAPNHVKLLPTQIISSIGNFIIAGILFAMAKRNKKDGRVGSMYMILYGIGRFLIEFLRDDPRGEVGFLSTSQFISLFIVAAGVILYVIFGRRPDAEPAQVAEEASDEDEENEDEAEEESEGSEESGAEEESEGSEEAAKETEKADDPETKSEEEKSE